MSVLDRLDNLREQYFGIKCGKFIPPFHLSKQSESSNSTGILLHANSEMHFVNALLTQFNVLTDVISTSQFGSTKIIKYILVEHSKLYYLTLVIAKDIARFHFV